MTWMEMNSDIVSVKDVLIEDLKKIYPACSKRGNVFFTNSHGLEFEIDAMIGPKWQSLVISYGPEGEDGDRFYPEDYDSLEDLIKAMIDEIEEEY